MALQAQQSLLTALQQEVVHTSVGSVARRTTFHPHDRVLINKRAALLHVAADAGLPIGLGQLEVIHGAVRVVAIRTLHETLGNPMMFRQRELRLHGPVAGIAKLRLRLLQQAVRQPGILFVQPGDGEEGGLGRLKFGLPCIRHLNRMDGMAVNATDAGGGMG